MNNLEHLKSILENPQRVVIIMHHQPDGDALASSLALARLCEKEGHSVSLVSPTKYPRFFHWMEDIQKVLIFEKEKTKVESVIQAADTIFLVDFVPYHRMGKVEGLVIKSKAFKVAIDHHPDEGEKVDLLFCDETAPATSFLLYELILAMGKEHHIDPTLATALYVGILTDTGSFAHANTTPATHRTTAALIERGVDISGVYHAVYGNQSLQRMRFLAHAITRRLVVLPTYQTAYFSIPRKDFHRFKLQAGDKGGIVNYALNLQHVALAALIVEQKSEKDAPQEVSLSLRSLGDIPVNEMAAKYFGGGGHKNAAGAISRLSLDEVTQRFEEMVRQEMKVQ